MSTLSHPMGGFPLDPQSEAKELCDIGARDTTPALRSTVTWDDVDRMWAAQMERRDRDAACPQRYRNAVCEGCACALYLPVGQGGDVLCPQCQREGELLAAEDATNDDGGGPRPPASGAMHPDYPEFAASAARMLDDDLCSEIGVADAEPGTFRLEASQQIAFLAAMAAEVVRRFEGRRPA